MASKKPDDLRQVTTEYTQFTKKNWPAFSKQLRNRVKTYKPEIKAILQLGDISEGLAGSEQKAEQMAQSVVKAVDAVAMSIPWIITKGNHDITGPGAQEAFIKYYIPMFQNNWIALISLPPTTPIKLVKIYLFVLILGRKN